MKTFAPKRLIMAGLSALTLGFAPAAQAETLADALVAAYRNSNLLDQNRAVLRAADEDVASAVASLRPVLNFIASVSHDEPRSRANHLTAVMQIAAEVTLFDNGVNRLGVEIAKESVLATREALIGVEQDVLLNAVAAYMDVRSASQSVGINENSVSVIDEELRAAEDRFEVGEVTRTDVALAQARRAQARAALSAAQGRLAAARESYRAATGRYPGALAAAPAAPRLPGSVDEARALAQRTHPAIRQSQRQVTVAELSVALAAASRGPNVTGSAAIAVDRDGNDSSSLGLQLRQPIYTGGALSASHRRAIAQRDSARAGLLQTSLLVSQNVATSWANIAVSRAQITAIDEQIRAATVAYRGVREEATLGARTTLDVLDAEQDLLDARASRITADADLQVAIYSLLASMGLLTVENLNLGIPTYDPAAYYNAVRNAPATSVQGERLDRVLRSIGGN